MRRSPLSEIGPMAFVLLILAGRVLGLCQRLFAPVLALVLTRPPEVRYVQQVGRVYRRPRLRTDCSELGQHATPTAANWATTTTRRSG